MPLNRRKFLAATMGTTVAGSLGRSAAAAPLDAVKGLTKSDLPTPALLLDLDLFEANLKTMADHCKRAGIGHRPHAKTHKCPEIAKRQVGVGALGVCAATVFELEAMVTAGVRGVLLTSPIVEPRKLARMTQLVKLGNELMLAVGHPLEIERLSAAAAADKVVVDVLIDVDVGDRRTGILPGQPALELARLIGKNKHLRLRGLQAYAGHASHAVGFDNRDKVSREALAKAVETKELLAKDGFDMKILSGGSTGTYNIDSSIAGVTELQVGSYAVMDVDYRRIGGKSGPVYTDFHPSMTVLTTVVSATHPDRVSVDAGTKAFSTDAPYKPEAKNWPGISYNRGGDEFGILTLDGGKLPKIGDRLEFIVPHCDPTMNLYDRIYALHGDKVEEAWPILARKENRA